MTAKQQMLRGDRIRVAISFVFLDPCIQVPLCFASVPQVQPLVNVASMSSSSVEYARSISGYFELIDDHAVGSQKRER